MASVDVKLTTKFIEVGVVSGSFVTTYGYNSYDTTQAGDCNEVANGSTDTAIPNVYGGSDNITRAHHLNSSGGGITYLFLDNDSNSTWSKFRIGSSSGEKTYLRSAATFTDLGTEGRWHWSATTNSYGTTAGADVPLTIFGTVENALTSVAQPNTSITSGDTSETWQINSGGGTSGQKYRIVLVSGTNADGDSAGAILQYGTYTGTALTLTLNNGDLPTNGNTCNYKVETSTGNSTFVETESGFWTNCTGTGSTFSIARAAGTSAPVISSVTNNNASSPNVTATVNLSSTGSGGTLQYAQTTGTGVPSTGWQSSASFTQARGTTRYYWASQATNTAGTFDGPETEVVGYISPDTTISVASTNIEITSSATSFSQTISNETGSSTANSTITQYRIKDSSATHESRTNYGSITVTDAPTTEGTPKSYSVEARVTSANGGSGSFINCSGSSFTVTKTSSSSGNDPTLDTYGLAIYDNNGDLITSFTAGHTVLRKIFVTSSAVALSTSTHTDIDTGLTGVTTSNCVIALEGETSTQGTTGSVRLPATFVTGGNSNIHVRVGRVTSAQSVNVEVLQHSGATLGAASTSYGMSIKNGNAETVVDESSEVFSVREIIDINTSLSSQVLYSTSTTNFIYLELTQGRYPGSAGPPVPAVNCSQSVLIIPPILTGVKHSDGSYKTVLLTMPKPTSLSNFKLAMLVPASSSPEYYGGSASSYGLEFRNTSGTVVWRSDFKQAIANNIIDANQFTSGTNQNGNYDVTTGRDGVTAPVATTSDFELNLLSSDTSVSLTGLNEMDPAKSYVSGSLTAMFVDYYKGRHLDAEQNIDTPFGGGQHLVGLRVTGNTTATLGTYRFRDGSTNTSSYGQRNPQSYHPEGDFVVFRIA